MTGPKNRRNDAKSCREFGFIYEKTKKKLFRTKKLSKSRKKLFGPKNSRNDANP